MRDSSDSDKVLRKWPVAVGLFLGVFLLGALTISDYGLTWDEPAYFHASDLHIQWLADLGKNLLNGQVGQSLQDETIKAAWHWDPYHIPHPPFSRILSGLTKAAFSPFIDKFIAYRLAPVLFFALLITTMYFWMAELFDRKTGILSALTLVLTPNLFGYAHFAVTDMPLAAMWFATTYCFWRGLKDWKWGLILGLTWGLALSTKFPALLIPIPLLLWGHLYHRHAYSNNVFAMSFLSPLIMVACQPYLWHQTSLRVLDFLYEGVSRGYRPETNFTIVFFGRSYFTSELPWYYSLFITAMTTPETILGLVLVGVIASARGKEQRQVMLLFLLNAAFILAMGLFPGAVLHDAIRQLLPVLPFLVGLAGGGFFALTSYLTERAQRITALQTIQHLRAKLIGAVLALVLIPPALEIFFYHPYELSYYNRLVGGIRGAYQRGLEVTYFMEAMTPGLITFLNDKLPSNAVVNASFANFMLEYYQKENRLRRDIRITDKADFDYYILLNRRSALKKWEVQFANKNPTPYATVTLGGVPLVSIYRVEGQNSLFPGGQGTR